MRTKVAAATALSMINRHPDGRETVVQRLRRGLAEAGLDCGCRETANDLVDKVGTEEELMIRAGGLAEAR